VNPAVPEELDAIVLTALTKEPVDRFQTAQEFSEALERAKVKLQGGESAEVAHVSEQRPSIVHSAADSNVVSQSYSEVAASVAVADENTFTPGLELVAKSNGVVAEHHTNGSAAAVEINHEAPLAISNNGVTPAPANNGVIPASANRGPAAEVQSAQSQSLKPFSSWGTSQFLAACVVMFLIGSVAFFALLALMRP